METNIFSCATNFSFIKKTSASSGGQICLHRRPLLHQETIDSSGDQCLFRRSLSPQQTVASSGDHCLLRRPLPTQEIITSSGKQCLLMRPVTPKETSTSSADLGRSKSTQCPSKRFFSSGDQYLLRTSTSPRRPTSP